jgi:hypothetical protein
MLGTRRRRVLAPVRVAHADFGTFLLRLGVVPKSSSPMRERRKTAVILRPKLRWHCSHRPLPEIPKWQ